MWAKLTKIKNKEVFYVFLLLALTIPLRFINLGYSDYIGDEHKSFLEYDGKMTMEKTIEFFLTRRKGPMQFLVSEIPHSITGSFRNELVARIPYAIFGVLSVLMFYKLVEKLTKNKEVALISASLLSLNGFIVGFGRIAQYQNLNLFFSFTSLYFYADLLYKDKNLIRSSLLGTAMFCISLLSHWDAIFILPLVVIIFIKYLINKKTNAKEKARLLVANLLLGSLILLPFLIPYLEFQKTLPANLKYLGRRLDYGYYNVERYVQLINLYNPFYTLWFLVVGGALGAIFYKKSWMYTAWFAVVYGFFEIFVRKPGTHIYNFLIPVFILTAVGLVTFYKLIPKVGKKILITVLILSAAFFFYQAYVIFVDHAVEYPWEEEKFFTSICKTEDRRRNLTKCGEFLQRFETPAYTIEDKLPLFGFPLYRHWNEIDEIIIADSKGRGDTYVFQTNEEKTISQWYMENRYGTEDAFYVVGVKRPLSFRDDWQYMHVGRKNLVAELFNGDRLVVKIWRVDPRE